MAILGQGLSAHSTAPSRNLRNVTPDDDTDILEDGRVAPCRGFTVNGAGNVRIIAVDDDTGSSPGQEVTIAVLAGYVYPISVRRFLATGTSATGIVAHY